MKELSKEEKAKAYDEAVEIIRDYYEKIKYSSLSNALADREVFEKAFPQLKESEDERIRKELISALKFANVKGVYDKHIAWLEKQGEPIDKIVKRATTGKQRVLLTETNGDANIDWDTRSLYDVKLLLEYGLDYIKKLEKQGEQKPIDKVKPKFHEGDWVVYDNRAYQVVELPKEGYINLGLRGNEKIEFAPSTYCRPWTIQDAKDGDVLACGNDIVIFKENNYNPKDKSGCMFVYCSCNNFHEIGGINPTDYKPATKEQRDLLFKKMKEAGYEWDAEKKELKKIEQKPTTKLEYDENGEPILTPFEAELFSMMSEVWQGYLLGKEVNIAKIVKEHSAELLERANEQNPVVYDKDAEKASEEYRNFRMSCGIKDPVMLNEIEEAYYEGAIRKQKPAWSEEEEDNIDGICYLITENCDAEKASELITWLKSLKDRYAWKPSDEQMKALNTCIMQGEISYVGQGTELQSLYNDLKKLTEKNYEMF